MKYTQTFSAQVDRLRAVLADADAVVIGAGAGLSTSAGFTYSGARFDAYFSDFATVYGFSDMYTGGFHPYGTPEEFWAYWSRYIFVNRYTDPPKPVYRELFDLVKDKDCFVLTTNVDHCFQKAGFDKERLFYTQGDYGLWQCSVPCHAATYDNASAVREMLLAQGFSFDDTGRLSVPQTDGAADFGKIARQIPSSLVPHCPVCGAPMAMNLRSDATFVEDDGWHAAAARYDAFLRRVASARVLYLELGVGGNTPGIVKFPFWVFTDRNPHATYACVNFGEAFCPPEIADRSICIDADIADVLAEMR